MGTRAPVLRPPLRGGPEALVAFVLPREATMNRLASSSVLGLLGTISIASAQTVTDSTSCPGPRSISGTLTWIAVNMNAKSQPASSGPTSIGSTIRASRRAGLDFGFNEWFRAQDGTPQGQDWQTWSAAMYLYAATAVERGQTPFFDEMRERSSS